MTTFVIGDVQGCYDSLQHLINKISFDPLKDHLIFAGDIVNRGPKSLKTLRFIKSLGDSASIVLGNHDLHLISVFYNIRKCSAQDTLSDILAANDVEDLILWLRQQPLAIHDKDLNVFISHAGLYPKWTLRDGLKRSRKFSKQLKSNNFLKLLNKMYGNKPTCFKFSLSKYAKLRFTVNSFTRMRYCTVDSSLDFSEKKPPESANKRYIPWFKLSNKRKAKTKFIFGHWSSLGLYIKQNIICLDTGCVWGNKLTAYNVNDDLIISVNSIEKL